MVPNRAHDVRWDLPSEFVPRSRSGLNQQVIVDAAIAVADTEGLNAVSIRRVASDIGVQPMSLYTHIESKAQLLDLMANELIGLMILDEPPPGHWRSALTEIARLSHQTFVAHPWVLEAFARGPRVGPNIVRHAKQMARAVAGLDLTPANAWTVLGIVDDYVMGHALHVAVIGPARDLDGTISETDRAEFPELAALASVDFGRASLQSFEIGLQTVLDGVERRFLI